jgi:hypothetical protein
MATCSTSTCSREQIEDALKQCVLALGYEALKKEQENAIISFVEGNDAFTSYGGVSQSQRHFQSR